MIESSSKLFDAEEDEGDEGEDEGDESEEEDDMQKLLKDFGMEDGRRGG